jgi:hypothetical protein
VQANLNTGEATEVVTGPGDLQDRMLKYEKALIKQALAQVNGSVYFLPSRSYPVTDQRQLQMIGLPEQYQRDPAPSIPLRYSIV